MSVTGELSEDGKWIWNGSEWKPFAPPEMPEKPSQPDTNSNNPNLVQCRDCGHEISKRAVSCPNCGVPRKKSVPFKGKNYRVVANLAFVFGLFFLVGINYGLAFLSLVIGAIFSILFYSTKSSWQIQNGKDNTSSVISILIFSIFLLILLWFFFWSRGGPTRSKWVRGYPCVRIRSIGGPYGISPLLIIFAPCRET